MGLRLVGISISAALIGAVAVACAVGSAGDPDGVDGADAAELEASTTGKPRDGGTGSSEAGATPSEAGPDDAGPTVNAACVSALAKATYDFEASDQGWTHQPSDNVTSTGVSWPFDPWSRGAATSVACPSGKCWAAEATQKYAQCQRGELVSPRIDLSACAGEKITLVFTHAYAFWTGSWNGQTWFDGGIVEISMDDGSSWQLTNATFPGVVKINPDQGSSYRCALSDQFHVSGKPGFTGSQKTPLPFEIPIPANYLTDKVRVRFSQASGVSSQTTDANASRSATQAGWRVDDVHFVIE